MSSKQNNQIPQIYGALTDVGNIRSHNEDSFVAETPLFVVADGMGGHEAGEVASEIAVNTMLEHVPEGPNAQELAEAVCMANRAVLRGAADGTGKPGMGTTMTAALIYGNHLVIAQVGDSRAYLLHHGKLQKLTRDHSLVADLVEQGRITEEEARYHPQRSVITRALGSDPNMRPDTYSLQVEEGDRLLLCSDGLSSMVTDDVIEAILVNAADPNRCCSALVAEALAAGGLDNVTVVVVDPLRKLPESEEDVVTKGNRRRAAKKEHKRAPILWAIAFAAILLIAGFGISSYINHSYFLIAEDGVVCIYRGLPGSFMGIHASWLEEKTDVPTDVLAPTTASRLENGISVDSLDEAQNLIQSYRETAGLAPASTDTLEATPAQPSTSNTGQSSTTTQQ